MKNMPFSTLSLLASLLLPTAAQASPSYFLQLAGIDGGSTVKGYEKWIDVESYVFDITMEPSSGDGGVGTPLFSDFFFEKNIDSASTKIFEHLVTGSLVASAVFEVVELGIKLPTRLITYSFTDLRFESFQHTGSEPGLPIESVAFSFATIGLQTFGKDALGGSKPVSNFTWDLKQAAAVGGDAVPTSPTPLPASTLMLCTGLLTLAGTARVARARSRRKPLRD